MGPIPPHRQGPAHDRDPDPTNWSAIFRDARRWDEDRLASALRSRRLAWATAGVAGGLAVVAVGAVALLAPLKTVEPFVVRVDRVSGAVDVMRGLSDDEGPVRYEGGGQQILSRPICSKP